MIDTKALRNKILDLAISGKLTEQLPEDGNAEDLYVQIQGEKAKLIEEGKIKKEKPLPPITEEEIPFDIPDNWKWVRLGNVINEIIVPQRDKPKFSQKGTIPWCRIEDRDGDYLKGSKSNQLVSKETVEKMNLRICPQGTILSACSGASIGTILITTVELCTNQTFNGIVCGEYLYNLYIFWFLKTAIQILKKMGTGSAMAYISQEKTRNMIMPLPPLIEQKRIVSAIEDAFAVIDRIEKAQESYYADQEVLKNKIIDAGIRGKLTEQLPEDGNAEELYAQIQEEKTKLIAEGKIKKEKPLPPIAEEEIPFEIPKSWMWIRLGNIIKLNCGYAFKSTKYSKSGYRVLRISDFNEKGIINKNIVRHPFEQSLEQYLLEENDIVMCMTGGTVGKNTIIGQLDEPTYVNQRVADIKPIHCNNYYIYIILNSSMIQKLVDTHKRSTNDNISANLINNFIVPLLPRNEQGRLYEAIYSIMNILAA